MTTPAPYGSGETSAAKVLRLFPGLTLDAQQEEKKAVPIPRFQVFSAIIHLDKYRTRKAFYLYGDIKSYSPYYNVQASCEDVWLPPDEDVPAAKPLDYDVSTLFCAVADQPVRMKNNDTLLALTNTSIPLFISLLISMRKNGLIIMMMMMLMTMMRRRRSFFKFLITLKILTYQLKNMTHSVRIGLRFMMAR